MKTQKRSRSLHVVGLVTCAWLMSLALVTGNAAVRCPYVEPADLVDSSKFSEAEKREVLLCRCKANNGGISPAEVSARYLVLINDDYLAQFDLDCDLELDPEEKKSIIAAQTERAETEFRDRVSEAKERTSYRRVQVARSYPDKLPPVSYLLDVNADPTTSKNSVSIGYSKSGNAAQDKESFSLGFSFLQTPWRSPTTNSVISVGGDLALKRDWTRTVDSIAKTRTADLIPISWKTELTDALDLSFGAGAAYIWTEKTNRETGEVEKERNPGFVYSAKFDYETRWPCLSLGLTYKIRMRTVFDDRLSYEWVPTVSFDFIKSCKPGSGD